MVEIEAGTIDKLEVRILVVLAGFAILLAIPMTLRFGLGWDLYWANTGNIFTDWSIYYLDFLPAWIITSALLLSGNLTFYNLAKWIVVFFLGYWLLYDWTWWMIVAGVDPGGFSWIDPFYFDIIVKEPRMWFFLIISVIGFLLSLLVLKLKDSWYSLLPFVLYLVYIYALGGITEVMPVEDSFYVAWSVIWLLLISASAILASSKTGLVKRCDCKVKFRII